MCRFLPLNAKGFTITPDEERDTEQSLEDRIKRAIGTGITREEAARNEREERKTSR